MRIYYKECFIEDIYHFDALDVLEGLKIGDTVCLFYEDKDPCYKERVMVKTSGKEKKILGLLSIDDSKSVLPFLKNEWKKLFSAQICFADKTKGGENNRIEIVIYINDNK